MRIWDDMFNLQAIAERLRNEAEDVMSFADMMQAEIQAYYDFKDEYKPYDFNMWEEAHQHGKDDFVTIGAANMTQQDQEYEQFKEIYPISYIDDEGHYVVEYKLLSYYEDYFNL